MNAKGASSSDRFSARLKCNAADEVPGWITPFQELLQRLLRIGAFVRQAASICSQSAASTSAFRYSPPGIGGAALARAASVSAGGAAMMLSGAGFAPPSGCADVHSSVT